MADEEVQTRERLLDAAEKLVALRGEHGASTRAITLEAGQRHKSAIQYHFGTREELMLEVWTRGSAAVEELRQRRMQALDVDTADLHSSPLAQLVRLYIEPLCQYLDSRAPSYWARFNEQALLGYPAFIVPALTEFLEPHGQVPLRSLLEILQNIEKLTGYDETTSRIRLSAIVRMVIGSLAAWERDAETNNTDLTAQAYGEHLVDLAVAALQPAPSTGSAEDPVG